MFSNILGMETTVLTSVVLPCALAIVMFGMGLSLIPEDFCRVTQNPKAALVGLGCQLFLLPALAFFVAKLFGLSPVFAIGLVVVAVCPGGVVSNAITYLAKGDVALSVSLTAVSSVLSPFIIPFVVATSVSYFQYQGQAAVSLPLGRTIATLLAITVVPIIFGMTIRRAYGGFAQRAEKPFRVASLCILLVIIAGIVRANWTNLPGYLQQVGIAVLVLNVSAICLGVAGAWLARLCHKQLLTIGIEVGIQNGTTALVITGTLLGVPEMSIPPAVYSLLMFFTGSLFVFFGKRFFPRV